MSLEDTKEHQQWEYQIDVDFGGRTVQVTTAQNWSSGPIQHHCYEGTDALPT